MKAVAFWYLAIGTLLWWDASSHLDWQSDPLVGYHLDDRSHRLWALVVILVNLQFIFLWPFYWFRRKFDKIHK
jgi:hypothetical protein